MTELGFTRTAANDGIHGDDEIVTNTLERESIMKRTYYRLLRKFTAWIGGDHYTTRFIDMAIQIALYVTATIAIVCFFAWEV